MHQEQALPNLPRGRVGGSIRFVISWMGVNEHILVSHAQGGCCKETSSSSAWVWAWALALVRVGLLILPLSLMSIGIGQG